MEDLINFPDRLDEQTAFRLNIKRDVGLDVRSHKDGGGECLQFITVVAVYAQAAAAKSWSSSLSRPIWPEKRKAAIADSLAMIIRLLE